MAEIESFTLDHTAVLAPYVRRIGVERGPHGDAITNFDVRFTQPNVREMPTAAVHTIEHLLAGLLRDRIDGVIDISPFGCRTGFHLLMWGEPAVPDVVAALTGSLRFIADDAVETDVPAVSAVECGNYRDHSLHSAREWARVVLDEGISTDAFARVGV
ncbi:S-ribosylhomocysteine lyase [Microbacterium dextranolyticum]|uniref:S-ribosylhomocysteine lyase n=1 Tax=Microbacterium dextranolyticum TaxID=36806 RepID=A0A9W6HIS0_9MICO|nr:S-ribosylhomocysteine lyase [Microbacterium dextranolyticum]MBM7461726.1 S-ribosylhomocysteine lyase [Microbacterium dextranolyticum]GLJ93967.1 S-ribosylhomocysteine lyase [Microbacterium dextranolyticum]